MDDVTTPALTCPKCRGAMRSYERSGVVIDQCDECRGVYLDRGEIERLISAEQLAIDGSARTPTSSRDRGHAAEDSAQGSTKHHSNPVSKRRRGGFLGELFD